MLKYLLVIGVIAFVYYFFIKKKPLKNSFKKQSSTKNTKQNGSKLKSNDMIECPTCGVYCEVDEAIISNAKYYCSTECLERA